MSYIAPMRPWRWVLGGMLLCCGIHGFCAESSKLTAQEIVDRMVFKAGTNNMAERRAAYNYSKRSVTEKIDSDGAVTERKEKLLQFERGRGRVLEIKVNGRRLSDEELRQERQQIA